MSDCDEYDPVTCLTAGELRAIGVAVPEEIPDCGWVRRSSIKFGRAVSRSSLRDLAEGRFAMSIPVTIEEPFKWIEIKGTVGP